MPKTAYEEERWAIVGKNGMYTGAELTRRDAISRHVEALYLVPRMISREGAWAECKKRGDKAIKVRILYEA
jgi:hypothetical protein